MKHLAVIIIISFTTGKLLAQYSEIVYTSFEYGSDDCQIIFDTSSSNLWQICTPEKPFFGEAYSSPHAILTDTVNPYPIANHSSFILKFAHNVDNTYGWNFTGISF